MKINSDFRILGFNSPYQDADTVVFGAPFDGTSSFVRVRASSPAIRNDSYGIETYSPYQYRDMAEIKGHDLGIWIFPSVIPTRLLKKSEIAQEES